MTDKEIEELRAIAKKEFERAKKAKRKPLTIEERLEQQEFVARCESEGRCKKIVLN